MKPIFLVHGFDWTRQSAGIRCLHKLAETLYAIGEDVYISHCNLSPDSNLRIWDDSYYKGRKLVLIEPEINAGQAPVDLTVRWLLNKPGRVGTDVSGTWGKNDLVAHFDKSFAIEGSVPLVVPHVDRTYFYGGDVKRDVDCFYAKKAILAGEKRTIPVGAIDVSPTAGNVASCDWSRLANIFRRTKTFYTMEETATSIEAALCGAKVEYILNDYMPEAPDISDLSEWYSDLEKRSNSEVNNFIQMCYDSLGLYVTA